MIDLKIARIALLTALCEIVVAASCGAQTNTTDSLPPPPPVPRVYSGIPQTPWYTNPAVREHLDLTDKQIDQLNQRYLQNYNHFNQAVTSLGPELTPIQRWEQTHPLHNGFYNNFNQTTDTVITNPDRRTRYNQLQRQYRRYGALNEPTVQDELNLSETQRRDVSQAHFEETQRMARWNQDYNRDPDRVIKQFNQSRGDYQEHLKTLLTPQQQRRWEAIVGAPYDFPAEAYFDGETTVTTAKPASP